MRQTTIGVYTIIYPEPICWLKDNNTISITSGYGPFTTSITIKSPRNTLEDTITITNRTPLKDTLFDLNESFRYLYKPGDDPSMLGNWSIEINLTGGTGSGTFQDYFSFNIQVYDGISFSTKTHGTSNAINIYDAEDLSNVYIYSPVSGEATIGTSTYQIQVGINQLDLSNDVNSDTQMCLHSSLSYPPIASITGDIAITPYSSDIYFTAEEQEDPGTMDGGSLWNRKQIFPMCYNINLIEPCDTYPFSYIRYINSDGVYRYIGGKVLSVDDSSTLENYNIPRTLIYNAAPRYTISESSKIIHIGSEVTLENEISDILYSSKLWIKDINGDWIDCQLNKTNITDNLQEGDIELEIIVHKS